MVRASAQHVPAFTMLVRHDGIGRFDRPGQIRTHGIRIAYALGRERRTNTELEEQRRRLNIEIGMLKDPDRIIGIAREKLGMGPPAPENVVRLSSGSLTPPLAAAAPPPSRGRK